MNNLGCKLSLPFGPSTRDTALEADLQSRLDRGHRIFAIGDIHGHFATFRALLHRLRLKPEDRVVCLGDMIDRGPDTSSVVELLRRHPQVICVKGNHEHMAVQCVQPDGSFETWGPWMKRGGKSTYGSYIVAAEGDLYAAKRQMLDDFMWLDTLPSEIILDRQRLVHAGYDPRVPIEQQGEKELLWVRKAWYKHDAPVDVHRTVFFGHTTTTKMGESAGDVAFSNHDLVDGRPAWACLDVGAYNHVAPGIAAIDIATLRITKQPTLRCDRWFEQGAHSTGRSGTWRAPDGRKEAMVADSFGLRALANRTRRATIAQGLVLKELKDAGLMPPQRSESATESIVMDAHRANSEWTGPTSFRVYRRQVNAGQPNHHASGPSSARAR